MSDISFHHLTPEDKARANRLFPFCLPDFLPSNMQIPGLFLINAELWQFGRFSPMTKPSPVIKEAYEQFLQLLNGKTLMAAEENGAIIGYACSIIFPAQALSIKEDPDKPVGFIATFKIANHHPNAENIGKRFLTEILSYFRARQVPRIAYPSKSTGRIGPQTLLKNPPPMGFNTTPNIIEDAAITYAGLTAAHMALDPHPFIDARRVVNPDQVLRL